MSNSPSPREDAIPREGALPSEDGLPSEDALRLLPAPVTVVGVRRGAELGGLTAAWVTRVSTAPVLLLVAIGRERYTHEMLAGTDQMTISVLAADQVEVARRFGLHSRREIDKWALTDHILLGEGLPAVSGCAAAYLCRIVQRFATGDHDCLVGEVLQAEVVAGGPALPMRGADYAPRPESA